MVEALTLLFSFQVRDHCHLKGLYLGPSHQSCNLNSIQQVQICWWLLENYRKSLDKVSQPPGLKLKLIEIRRIAAFEFISKQSKMFGIKN